MRLKDRRRRLVWVKVAAGTAVVAILLCAAFYVSRLPNVTITNVEVAGINTEHAESVKAIAEEKLKGSYGYIIPKTNAFFVPRSEITASILSAFPVAGDVDVSQKDPNTIVVSITERKPAGLWCASLESGEPCYYIDENGFVYADAESGEGFIRYFGAISGDAIGQTFPDFASLREFVDRLQGTIERTPESAELLPNDDITIRLKEGGELKFVFTEELDPLLQNIASVFASQSFTSGREFEYADFRYGNKVYVKFKGE